jgi:hypothetical protein
LVHDNWQDILMQLRQADRVVGTRSVKVGALMGSVALVGLEGQDVIVEASSDWLKSRVEEPTTKVHVEEHISQAVGSPVKLRCVLKGEYQPRIGSTVSAPDASSKGEPLPEETGPSPEQEPESTDSVSEADAQGDPMLREALDLGAEIRSVE